MDIQGGENKRLLKRQKVEVSMYTRFYNFYPVPSEFYLTNFSFGKLVKWIIKVKDCKDGRQRSSFSPRSKSTTNGSDNLQAKVCALREKCL